MTPFGLPGRVKTFTAPFADGNYSYSGTGEITISSSSTYAATFAYIGTGSVIISSNSDYDGKFNYTGTGVVVVSAPDTGVYVFNSGVPYTVQASVTIDGQNYTNSLLGVVNVTREENAAATFDIEISSTAKAATFLNKQVKISFFVSDGSGNMVSFTPLITGRISSTTYIDGLGVIRLQGFDYRGVHNTDGELMSEDITTVLTGSKYISGSGTFSTGFAPIWGVNYLGTDDIVDGRDYFVNTLTGTIEVPISSNFVDSPGGLGFSYAVTFDSLKALIENIAGRKGWSITEDGVTITDYTTPAKQPVVSLSNESVIDAVSKFLELNGAKMECNLFPKMRIYSDTVNITGADNHVLDESKYYEDSLEYTSDLSGLITKQTVRSVAKTFANIVIGDPETLAEKSGFEPFDGSFWSLAAFSELDLTTLQVHTVVVKISKTNISSVSHTASGTFSPIFINSEQVAPGRNIEDSDWAQTITDNEIIFTLTIRPQTATNNANTYRVVAYPWADWGLTITGTKINYGEGQIEETVEVTGTRGVTGITEEMIGDVHENAYMETAGHAGDCVNAILTERGNIYTSNGVIPMHEAAAMNIGNKINNEKASATRFKGVIKRLEYSLNTETAEAPVAVTAKGIGIGI
jgi:hypothetical protein